jgi:hemolysin III
MAIDPSDIYPDYSRGERIADGTMHAIGIIGSLVATIALISLVKGPGTTTDLIAVWVYGVVMFFAFVASAAYHMTPIEEYRPFFRKLDHAAIFLKIAGTYTPLVMLIGSHFSYAILGLVWALAIYGVIRKVFYWSTPGNGSIALYLTLGWMSLALAWPMVQTIPTISFWLVVFGGVTYTVGVVFYKWESLKYSNAIWHAFVLAASTSIYIAIYLGEMAKQNMVTL